MNIAFVGAGGVGGYYGGLLARAGHNVTMLARGEHLSVICERGLEIRTPEERFIAPVKAVTDVEKIQHPELAVIAVKSYSLQEVLPAIKVLAGKGSAVLPLLNGVDTVQQLVASGIPEHLVLGGLTAISAAKVAPGVIERRSNFAKVAVGEPKGGISERAERIAKAFAEVGVDAHASADITLEIWCKFAFIATMAAANGLARAPIGPVRQAPLGNLLLERAIREIVAVANARGIALAETVVHQTMAMIQGLAPQLKPSFLLDLERGGPTELDILSGAVSRMGREFNIETPIHDTATAALSAAVNT